MVLQLFVQTAQCLGVWEAKDGQAKTAYSVFALPSSKPAAHAGEVLSLAEECRGLVSSGQGLIER